VTITVLLFVTRCRKPRSSQHRENDMPDTATELLEPPVEEADAAKVADA